MGILFKYHRYEQTCLPEATLQARASLQYIIYLSTNHYFCVDGSRCGSYTTCRTASVRTRLPHHRRSSDKRTLAVATRDAALLQQRSHDAYKRGFETPLVQPNKRFANIMALPRENISESIYIFLKGVT